MIATCHYDIREYSEINLNLKTARGQFPAIPLKAGLKSESLTFRSSGCHSVYVAPAYPIQSAYSINVRPREMIYARISRANEFPTRRTTLLEVKKS